MHILLTDVLTCPRCGPPFGLIVLADRIAERQVEEGQLGCANCRSVYPIRGGRADLRGGGCPALETHRETIADPELPIRLAALLGVTRSGATLLVIDAEGASGRGVATVLPELHVVGAATRPTEGAVGASPMLSEIAIDGCLPFKENAFAGVAAVGISSRDLLGRAAGILQRGSRLVLENAGPDAGKELRGQGFEIHLEQDGVVVASPPDRR